MDQRSVWYNVDWISILLFLVFVIAGWLNVYAAVYDDQAHYSIFDLSQNSGKQLLWILSSFLIIAILFLLDYRFYNNLSIPVYVTVMLLLVFVLIFGREVAGSKSWFEIGSFRLQPAEFAKFATALMIAKYFDIAKPKNIHSIKTLVSLGAIIGLPVILIFLQGDTGTAMVFGAFVLVLYREGLSPLILLFILLSGIVFVLTLFIDQVYLLSAIIILSLIVFGIIRRNVVNLSLLVGTAAYCLVLSAGVDFIINDLFKPHQQNRIKALIDPGADPLGYGWNVTQSKIAIGSGGFSGKGFLQGTQTKFDFVPEQSTDFVFCTIGEEHGYLGSLALIVLFMLFLMRIIYVAERQKSRLVRVYGYGVASIFFFHFGVNIGMTIGLFPVVGIPLPFFSYGGSALWAFTLLLFVFIKMDAHRKQILDR